MNHVHAQPVQHIPGRGCTVQLLNSMLFKIWMVFDLKQCKLTRVETLEWDILNPDLLINPEINNMRRTSNI